MVFSSLEFIFLFLASVLAVYFLVPPKARNIVLLLFSLIFYGWGEPKYVFLMIGTITVDYICGYIIGKNLDKNKKLAKTTLVLSVVINLAILGLFKYYDFIVGSINSAVGRDVFPLLGLTLPIGISFYTFQALSYVIDVYRRDARMQKDICAFGTYVTLFPQLIAGPIVRYADVDGQLRTRTHSLALFASGCRTFICGLAKKVLLANAAGAMWDSLSASASPDTLGAWLGIIFYSFQIYFDFSGYSDMAIGLGKMFGFTFKENFYYPYISSSVTEFWRRWHISLSTWFREYVYFPLGGNRKGSARTYFNLLCVWFLTGLWHGASWNFVLWGLYYFLLLVCEKAFLLKLFEKIPRIFSRIYSLFAIIFGWLLFAIEDMSSLGAYLGRMFGSSGTFAKGATIYDLVRNLGFILLLVIAATPLPKKLWYRFYEKGRVLRCAQAVLGGAIFIVCVAYLVDSSYNPFLYFRF